MTNQQKDPLSYWQSRALEAERALEQMKIDRDGAASACERLREDKRQLEAHVERLREAVGLAREPCRMWYKQAMGDGWEIYSRVRDALNETPGQSFTELRAEAVEQCMVRIDQFATEKQDCMREIQSFAGEIRSGER